MATIKDVAARAGVGIGTVSRVINDHPSVTPDTRARVQSAISTLDYHPSRVARALSRQRSNSIAVVAPFFTHTSLVERVRGILTGLADSPYELIVFNVDQARRPHARFARPTRRDLADGLITVSISPTAEESERLRESRIPTVVIDAEADGFPTICIDDIAGGRLAGDHLVELGHRRIAYIGDAEMGLGFTSSPRRREGLAQAMAAAGQPLDPDLIRSGPHGRSPARAMACELLALPHPPTAIFAHSDTQAVGVLDACREFGLRVPEDVSVMGFDDIEPAGLLDLTTVRQPLFESGRLGALRLLDLLEQPDQNTGDSTVLSLELMRRSTTGRAPRRIGAARPSTRTTRRSSA